MNFLNEFFHLNDQKETRTLLQMFVMLYAEDTVLFGKNAGDMQKALDVTIRYYCLRRMFLNIEKLITRFSLELR